METKKEPLEITNRLIKACEGHSNDRSFLFRNPQDGLAKKIIDFLKQSIPAQSAKNLEFTSVCLFYSLQKVLEKLNDQKFLGWINPEIDRIMAIMEIDPENLPKNTVTKYVIDDLTKELHKKSNSMVFNVNTLEPAWTIYVPCTWQYNKNGFLEQILLDGIYKTKDKSEMELMLRNPCLSIYKEDVLFHALKALLRIERLVINRGKDHDLKEWPQMYFEFADLIFNDKDFNPNYIQKNEDDALLDQVFNSRNYYLMNGFLQHPEMDLQAIKTWLEKDVKAGWIDQNVIYLLLLNQRFYALQEDWLTLANGAERPQYFQRAVRDVLDFRNFPDKLNMINEIVKINAAPEDVKKELVSTFLLLNQGIFANKINDYTSLHDVVRTLNFRG